MINEEGIIIHFDEEERNYFIQNDREEGITFSDALSVPDWKVKQLQVALLSFTGSSIDYICLATRGNRIVTGKSRVVFSDLVNLDTIPLNEVKNHFKPNIKIHFVKSSQGRGGRIPPRTWIAVIETIKKLRPDKKRDIEKLLSLKDVSKFTLRGSNTEILLQEREALGAALDIFCRSNFLRKSVLKSWSPNIDDITEYDDKNSTAQLSIPQNKASCFLSGIPSRYIQEESAIQHDLMNWENERHTFHEYGVSKFEQGSRLLEVVYANKNALEKTLGVDLIYYNREFRSFILVQYKLMKKSNVIEKYDYRPDKQIKIEIDRMNDFNKKFKCNNKVDNHKEFRLNNDAFMFKLVPNSGLKPASENLISGMYVTREYMEFLLSANGPKGERGGRIINFGNSPRYLTNTEFSSAVNRGWIGSNANQSDILAQCIKVFLETGRALLVAVEA